MTTASTTIHDNEERCPICNELFVPGVMCAEDIELGTCHAECLEGSPVVDLETGEPRDGPITTFPWEPWPDPYPPPPSNEEQRARRETGLAKPQWPAFWPEDDDGSYDRRNDR